MPVGWYPGGTPIAQAERPTVRVLASGKPILGQTLGVELADDEIIWITVNVVPIVKPGEIFTRPW